MKKGIITINLLIIASFLLVSCASKKESFSTKESVLENEPALEPEIKLQSKELLILQTNNNDFPQSQGVYDIHNDTLTIVKQYIPDDDPSITSEKLSDLYHEKLTIIKEDFASTFTEQELSTDLFQVYERVVPEITVSLEGRELILHGEEFQKSFYFVSGSTKIVVDGNNVEYEVKYDR